MVCSELESCRIKMNDEVRENEKIKKELRDIKRSINIKDSETEKTEKTEEFEEIKDMNPTINS